MNDQDMVHDDLSSFVRFAGSAIPVCWCSLDRSLSAVPDTPDARAIADAGAGRGELISPHAVPRDPITRDVLAELLTRIRLDSPAGRELRRMAYRVGLPT